MLPTNCNYAVINSTFDETLTEALDSIDEQKASLAPAFVMIDPFGVSDTPMRVVGRILENSRSEVYVSFMYRDINRFKSQQISRSIWTICSGAWNGARASTCRMAKKGRSSSIVYMEAN